MAKGYRQPTPQRSSGNMMSQFARLQEQMAQAQAELAETTVTEEVSGGVIKITMSGDQVCKAISIAPELLTEVDAELLQDMLLSGVNKALERSRKLSEEKMAPFTSMLGGLGLGR